MKYTRYDIRKRNNNTAGLIIIIIMVLILAYIIGSVISNLFLKNGKSVMFKHETPKTQDKEVTVSKKGSSTSSEVIFTVLQGGIFAQ